MSRELREGEVKPSSQTVRAGEALSHPVNAFGNKHQQVPFLFGCHQLQGWKTWSCHTPSIHLQHAPDGIIEGNEMGPSIWGAPYPMAQASLLTTIHLTAAWLSPFIYMDAQLSWMSLYIKIEFPYCCPQQKLKEVPCWPKHVTLVRSWITASSVCAMGTRGSYALGRGDLEKWCSFIVEVILEMSAGKWHRVVACHADRSQHMDMTCITTTADRSQHVDMTYITTANRFPKGKEKFPSFQRV